MIVLHQFVADFDLPNPSPFCMKVETFLRLAKIPYAIEPWSPMAAPLGKAPFLTVDDTVIPDSGRIVQWLLTERVPDFDVHVPAGRLAIARGLGRMLEEHTYWALLQTRWLDSNGWTAYKPVLATSMPMPRPLANLMLMWLRRGVRQSAYSHGLARHAPDEITRRATEDLEAIAAFMGEAPFMGGERPCSVDATVFAFLEQLGHPLVSHPLHAVFDRLELHGYLERMRPLTFPERTFPSRPVAP